MRLFYKTLKRLIRGSEAHRFGGLVGALGKGGKEKEGKGMERKEKEGKGRKRNEKEVRTRK